MEDIFDIYQGYHHLITCVSICLILIDSFVETFRSNTHLRQKSRYTCICCHVSKDISGQGKNHIICRSIISKIIYDFFAEEIVQETNVKESKEWLSRENSTHFGPTRDAEILLPSLFFRG